MNVLDLDRCRTATSFADHGGDERVEHLTADGVVTRCGRAVVEVLDRTEGPKLCENCRTWKPDRPPPAPIVRHRGPVSPLRRPPRTGARLRVTYWRGGRGC